VSMLPKICDWEGSTDKTRGLGEILSEIEKIEFQDKLTM